ncbi:hypothetical protein JCM3774_003735 [Rhodotorula dairenensis]
MDDEDEFSPWTPSSQAAREDDEQQAKLARLLEEFDAQRRKARRLRLHAVVSRGDKLAKDYEKQVREVFERMDQDMEKRLEQHRAAESRVTLEIRTVEKKLLESLAARSDTIQAVAEAVAHEVENVVRETREHAEAVTQVAQEEGHAVQAALDQLWTAAGVPAGFAPSRVGEPQTQAQAAAADETEVDGNGAAGAGGVGCGEPGEVESGRGGGGGSGRYGGYEGEYGGYGVEGEEESMQVDDDEDGGGDGGESSEGAAVAVGRASA